jgi:hypothetical protein
MSQVRISATAAVVLLLVFIAQSPAPAQSTVRRDTGLTCGSAAGFVVMAPRQQITPTPTANHAKSAFALDAADGSPANAVFVDNSGNVGIGTTTPGTKLHVNGADEGLRIDGPGLGASASAYVSFRDANGVRTGYVGDGSLSDASVYLASDAGDVHLYTGSAALTAKNNGNVGVGTTAPQARLDVRGDIRLGPSGQFQATAGEEKLRVIRGKVDGNGNILAGTGFSVIRTAEGEYTITFSTPFAGTPIMTASPEYVVQQDFNLAWIDAIGSSQMRVILVNFTGTGPDDGAFHFIATGPR